MKKVYIDPITLSEGTYNRTYDNKKYIWDVPTLIQYCKEEDYKSFKLPLLGIDTSMCVWDVYNIHKFIEHSKRVDNANLSHPVILNEEGFICDGWHRVVKAIVNGDEYIDAIRIEEMPEASSVIDIE